MSGWKLKTSCTEGISRQSVAWAVIVTVEGKAEVVLNIV